MQVRAFHETTGALQAVKITGTRKVGREQCVLNPKGEVLLEWRVGAKARQRGGSGRERGVWLQLTVQVGVPERGCALTPSASRRDGHRPELRHVGAAGGFHVLLTPPELWTLDPHMDARSILNHDSH